MTMSLLASRRVLLNLKYRPLQLRSHFKDLKEFRAPGRFYSSKTKSPASSSKPKAKAGSWEKVFPERLIIYHAGTFQSTFVACANVTSIFVFGAFCGLIAPNLFLYDPDIPPWVAPTIFISGLIPPIVAMYVSRPFVCFIHLRLPPYARASRELMLRFAKTLPKDAVLDITTIKMFGSKRINQVKVSELYPIQGRLKLANYGRDVSMANAERPWWMPRALSRFNVHTKKETKIPGGEAWPLIAATIAKRAPKI
ncbi:hypothetical protein HYFRA_00006364 [Hymenoscyphus fraxineus]|uniref:Uncharacterized protein n=1 Tax=Hymenoscyphus fraxineus TaxID=746836 RepID=A0A9N9KSV9_9HELO|nr:hypothetical protein HYFRA_00006364 [Hymenoscyphus fraxineus]